MKHVFYIHSNLTYLVALGVMCKENLDEKDVLIISRYKLENNLPVPVCFIDFTRNYKKPWKSNWMFSPYKYIDRIIEKSIGRNPFIAYVDAMVFPAKLIVSNPKCKMFHFIEEGSSAHYVSMPISYLFNDDVSPMMSALRYDSVRRRWYDFITMLGGVSLKNYALPYMPQCYYQVEGVNFYGFGDNVFKGAQRVCRLSWTDLNKRFQFKKDYDLSDSVLWLGIPPQVENINIPIDKYVEGIEKRCISHLKQTNVKKVYIKHHPVATPEVRTKEAQVFKDNGFNVEVINDGTCLEIELLGEEGIRIYTVMTSLVEYAHQMGVDDIYSIANHFPGFKEHDNTDLWDYVELI